LTEREKGVASQVYLKKKKKKKKKKKGMKK